MAITFLTGFKFNGGMHFVLWHLFLLHLIVVEVFATPNRCDVEKRVTHWTRCQECSVNALTRCPFPYNHTSDSEGVRGCPIRIYYGSVFGVVTVPGCQHTCDKMETYRECCSGFWGWDCEACPGNPVCSSAGKCFDKVSGNGTCSCQDGFQGTACEICTNSTMFGPGCNQTCTCERGICDNSLNSTGDCKPYSCQTGYIGANCETRLPACNRDVHLSCAKNADCFKFKGVDTCICDPGYTGDGNTSCSAINPCKGHIKHGCHSQATCQYLGPGKHKCECKQGYRGDGRFCLVIDPCTSGSNGGCPKNSSVCNFLGPGKSNCSCLHGFSNFTSGKGCSMIDMCNDGNRGGCDINANCLMVKPGEKRCNCKKGYRGNGTVCYGNIMKRIQQLENSGPPGVKGHLKQINQILLQTIPRPLADAGPFTVFAATDEAISSLPYDKRMQLNNNTDLASHIVHIHLVSADLDSFALKKVQNVTTLQGIDARISEANGSLFYSLAHSSSKAKIIARDFLAGNGMIYVVDRMFWLNSYVYTADLTLFQIIGRTKEFSQFADYLQLTGLNDYVRGMQGSQTFFVPVNSAFQFDQLTSDFLTKTNKGKNKLRSILRNHIVNNRFDIADLIALPRLKSDEGESNTIRRSRNGAIIIGKNAQITQSNILAKNGILHKINNLLIPQTVLPLVHNFANWTMIIRARGVCYRCDTMPSFPNKGCPPTYNPSGGFKSCSYKLFTSLGQFTFRGCQMMNCLKAKKIIECSNGYYGSSCRPCPGQILEKPCNLHGKCDDRIKGTGVCKCNPLFTGFGCEKCSNATMFGSNCNKTCTCVHGSCDNGIQGNGTCKPKSCQAGYHGDNCDITDKSCVGSPSIRCHYKARCVNDNGTDVCKCNAGYEGSGLECYEINPCAKPNRGGCHKDAKCTKTAPGTNICTCDKGFTGDGLVCTAINPCEVKPSCHSNAECKFLGPGQSTCQCKAGFTGDGTSCVEINNCLINNGGCSKKATCKRTGPGKSHCACFNGYIGNGYSCLGSVAAILRDDNRFSEFFSLITNAHMEFFLSMEDKNFTVFAPSSKAISSLSKNDSDYWTSSPDKLKYLLQHHVMNTTIFKRDFKNNSMLMTLAGQALTVTVAGSVTLNEQAAVTIPDIVCANGVVHGINMVLLPPRLAEPYSPSVMQALEDVQELSNFSNILAKQNDIKAKLDQCDGFYTIFAPVNDVLKSMSPKTLKYHIVTKYISPGHFFNGQEFPTMLSETNFKVKLTKSAKGKSEVNGVQFYDTQPIRTKCGIIYKLADVLSVPPQRHCDQTKKYLGVTLCRLCFFQSNCPSGWTKLRTQGCYFWIVFSGCQAVCQKTVVTKKCCSGFWGQDCQACPGNVTSSCSGNGKCDDGITGSGHCKCSSNFTGTSCEKCLPNRYGKDCTSKCGCVKGRCNEGPAGNGACKCFHGWHGARCSDRADAMKCHPTVCHSNATCRNISRSFKCDCDVGFTGNGAFCRAIHVCDSDNGGCHKHAICTPNPTDPSLASCSCKKGYKGDGQFCSAIDLCQTNNGGCHENATCASIGPGKRNCFCNDGYHGDGITCIPDNPCTVDNGGCSLRATCERTGPGQRKCTCGAKYYGDGVRCIGSSMEVLNSDPELTQINDLIKKYGIDKLLQSNYMANVLAPTNRALKKILNDKRRKRRSDALTPTVEQYLRYHIIGCVRFNKNSFKTGGNFTSLLGAPIWMTLVSEGNKSRAVFKDYKGNSANITQALESGNGFIFKLDSVLTPPAEYLEVGDSSKSVIKVANELGHTTSVGLLKRVGLENIVSSPYGRPYLVFLPTNHGIAKLPDDFKARLLDPANAGELTEYIKYHVVQNVPENLTTDYFVRSGGGVQFTTMQGQSIFISCSGDKGDLYVNGISRISKRDIHFKGGVAFVVDDVITPLGLGGKCDEVVHEKTTSRCSNCLSPEGCPHDSTLVGTINHNCSYDNGFLGCKHICMKRRILKKCCQNFYGSDCRACPGGLGMTCSRRGRCDDGLTGSGRCSCRQGFNGTACERCTVNSTCQVTSPCSVNNGGCHLFATCSNSSGHVKCKCKPGYEGDGFYCQMEDLCTVNNGGCGINATCHFKGPGQRRCQCKQGFHQVIDRCQGFVSSSPCAVNHGGCSDHAYCKDSNGTAACTCWESYIGNGYVCNGNILQTLQNTVKLQDFYKALYHLGNTDHEGQSLFSSLQIDSNYFTVFSPINSALTIKDLNLTLAKNFIISGRIVLSTINDVYTATNLLGTKIMIRRLNSGILTINGVAHVLGDLKSTNGLIYIVDQVIPIVGQIPVIPTTPPSSTSPTSTTPPSSSPSSSATTTSSSSSSSSLPSTSPPTTEAPRTSQTKSPSSRPTKPSTKAPRTSHTKFPSGRPSRKTKEPTGKSTTKTSNYTAKPGVLGRRGKDKGVSGGAVAGIVIAVLILIIIIAGVIWYLRKRALLPNSAFRYKKEDDTVQYDSDVFQENPPSLSYNNPMYDVSEPGPDRIDVHGDKSLPPPFKEHTDFTNPIYELEKRPPGESTDGASGMQFLFQDDEKPPGEEIC